MILFSLAAAELLLCLIFQASQRQVYLLHCLLLWQECAGYPNAIWKLNKLRISMYADADDLTLTTSGHMDVNCHIGYFVSFRSFY